MPSAPNAGRLVAVSPPDRIALGICTNALGGTPAEASATNCSTKRNGSGSVVTAVKVNLPVVSSQNASRTMPRPGPSRRADLLQLEPVSVSGRHVTEPRNEVVPPVEGPAVSFLFGFAHPCIMPVPRYPAQPRQPGCARYWHMRVDTREGRSAFRR